LDVLSLMLARPKTDPRVDLPVVAELPYEFLDTIENPRRL